VHVEGLQLKGRGRCLTGTSPDGVSWFAPLLPGVGGAALLQVVQFCVEIADAEADDRFAPVVIVQHIVTEAVKTEFDQLLQNGVHGSVGGEAGLQALDELKRRLRIFSAGLGVFQRAHAFHQLKFAVLFGDVAAHQGQLLVELLDGVAGLESAAGDAS
jgi:hypothetical protein